jgi:DNA repair protein RadC
MRGNSHVRFGKRDGRNRALEGVYDASVPTSRDPTPSAEDRTLTTRLREAGDLLGIRLLDHLILGDDRLYSFADQGWPL